MVNLGDLAVIKEFFYRWAFSGLRLFAWLKAIFPA